MNYQVIESTITLENITFISYGVKFMDMVIEDISTNKNAVTRLIALCNELDLDPIHIGDVVDDFLAGGDRDLAS